MCLIYNINYVLDKCIILYYHKRIMKAFTPTEIIELHKQHGSNFIKFEQCNGKMSGYVNISIKNEDNEYNRLYIKTGKQQLNGCKSREYRHANCKNICQYNIKFDDENKPMNHLYQALNLIQTEMLMHHNTYPFIEHHEEYEHSLIRVLVKKTEFESNKMTRPVYRLRDGKLENTITRDEPINADNLWRLINDSCTATGIIDLSFAKKEGDMIRVRISNEWLVVKSSPITRLVEMELDECLEDLN